MAEPYLIKHFVNLYVHMHNGAIYDLQLGALEEVNSGGTFVTRDSGQALGLTDLVNKNDVRALRLVGERHLLVFTVEGPEAARATLNYAAGADPLTLTANYGTKVTIVPYGPNADRVNGLKFTVTPPPPLEEVACGA